MLNLQLAKKYSRAIFEIAADEKKLKEYGEELTGVTRAVFDEPILRGFATNPQVPPEAKKSLFKKIFSGELSSDIENFIMLLIDKHRMDLLEVIDAQYQDFSNEAQGIVVADITTAHPLTGELEKLLAEKLEKATGRSVKLRKHLDAAIIGGAIAQIGDKRIDGSVQGRLAALRAEILANK